MTSVPLAYRMALHVLRAVSPLLALRGGKLARGVRGRRTAHEVLASWGDTGRDRSRPLVWFHAPSVGEGLMLEEVAEALMDRRVGVQRVFTHFSPSAEGLAAAWRADVSAVLPWDVRGPVVRALDALEPDLLVLGKTEVWPVLVEEAGRRGVPVAIVGASVPPRAGRLRWPARTLLRSTWGRLSVACACSDEDAAGLLALGVPEDAVHITGDPAVDSAVRRRAEADPAAPFLAPLLGEEAPTLVAGSTWPADEDALLCALEEVKRSVQGLRVVLAPHEPDPDRVRGLLLRLRAIGWPCAALSEVEACGSAPRAGAVVVDRVGVLALLYVVGRVAYVGGGFGTRGLHSVLEPAAAAVPVVFGPRGGAGHGARLLRCGGARSVPDAASLARTLVEWLTVEGPRGDAAKRAADYIDAQRGAAVRTADLLNRLIEPSRA